LFSSHHENLQKIKKVEKPALIMAGCLLYVAVQQNRIFTDLRTENKGFLLQRSNLELAF